jgi:transposase
MAKRKYPLTTREVNYIRYYLEETIDPRVRTRLRAVLMYGTGLPLEEILGQAGCSRSSLLNWCRSFRFRGLAGLHDDRQGGNNARLTDGQINDLARRLRLYTPSSIFGQRASTPEGQQWKVEDLFKAIKLWYSVVYQSRASYYRLLEICAPEDKHIDGAT